MSITMEQALKSTEFHDPETRPCDSKRGPLVWRRNGKTKTWKTRPGDFRIPVKFGLYDYDYITESDEWVHAAEDCPVSK